MTVSDLSLPVTLECPSGEQIRFERSACELTHVHREGDL